MARIDLSDTLQTPFNLISKKIDIIIPPVIAFILELLLGIALRKMIMRNYYFGMGVSKVGLFTFDLLDFIISFIMIAWVSAMFDDLINGKDTNLKESWNRISSILGNILMASILIAVLISFGLLLFIIPGIIIGIILAPVIPIMVKKNAGVQDALKESANFAFQDGNFWFILVILVITFLVGLIPYVGGAISGFLFILWVSYACVKYA